MRVSSEKIVSVIVRMRASLRKFRDNGHISVTKDFGGMSVQQNGSVARWRVDIGRVKFANMRRR